MRALRINKSFDHIVKQFFRYNSTESVKQLDDAIKAKRSTVDQADVKHHAKHSDQWWNLEGELRALHALNPLRVQFVRDGLANAGWKENSPSRPLEGVKILDAGCGGGILAEPLARIGANVTGIDASDELISVAKEHVSLDPSLCKKLIYVHGTVEELANNEPQTYDAVVASEILEHVADKELFLKSCVDILKPGGSIFVTTLNKTIQSFLGGIVAAEYILKLVAVGTHDWNKFIAPEETQRLLESCGCKTKLIHGMFYNPLKNEWFWTASTSINYAIHAVKKEQTSH
ncbi:ubiquinone biosynthesis O-methyltransferase, mitochondrial [Venturia canescens]|uniref:ubiquinone biosynthesis O-methyltransferase, mitochondrial n=1 Tax=Venturia canescens TaxID=32260 RepID=UPI001C9D4B78|nr:ubiquinone biosynthesis O-methyltransferase, mitochondrial [Venturia canescens]